MEEGGRNQTQLIHWFEEWDQKGIFYRHQIPTGLLSD